MAKGEKVRRERMKRNWSLSKLADTLGITTNLLTKIEKNRTPINNSISLILKEKLNVDLKPNANPSKSKEVKMLEEKLNKIFKDQKIAVDQDEKMVSVTMACEYGIYKTHFAINNVRDENEAFICNEAKAIMYELLQKIDGEE